VALVGGWHDDDRVYLIERSGEDARIRSFPAKWSAFFSGFDDDDRREMERIREVRGLSVDEHGVVRIDFRNRWARKDVVWNLGEMSASMMRAAGEQGPRIYEADVDPLRRMLSDNGGLKISDAPLAAYFDLEVDSRKTFDEMRAGKARILSWAAVDQRGREGVEVLAADTDAAERALLESLLEWLRPYDVALAWNGDGFDFPVLSERAAKLRITPGGKPPLWERWNWLDQMEVHKKYNAHAHESGEEKQSFALNAVAHVLLGRGKTDFDASRTWEVWESGAEGRARLAAYNLQDARLMPAIEEKTGYTALHYAVCAITRCFPDTRSLQAGRQGDGFLLRLGVEHGHRWPTKPPKPELFEQYSGAYVMEPTRLGAIDDVHVCDFASLYPSIIRSWNMSPETIVHARAPDPEGVGVCSQLYESATAPRFRVGPRGMFPLALDRLVATRGEYTKRADAAEPGSPTFDRFKRLSQAFKIVANSFYGILGSPYTRYFDRAVAESVTKTGAHLIKLVAARSRAAGLEAFYGDTDSVFVTGTRAKFARLVDDLNEEWPRLLAEHGCDRSYVRLEFEKSFKRLVLVSAKRYAGSFAVYKGKAAGSEMKPEVKGLEYKRGDVIRIAREMQYELITALLEPDLPFAESMQGFVERWKRRVLEGDLEVDDVVLSQSVKDLGEYALRYTTRKCSGSRGAAKCGREFDSVAVADGPEACPRCKTPRKVAKQPAHVRVAHVLRERGEDVRAGTRVEYLTVAPDCPACGEPVPSGAGKCRGCGTRIVRDEDAVVPARDPGALEKIDRVYYWESRVYPPCARILDVVYPDLVWVESAAQRKARELDEKRTRDRGRVDDLPLFGGDVSDSGVRRVVAGFGAFDDRDAMVRFRDAVLGSAPGAVPVVIRVEADDGQVAVMDGPRVSTTAALDLEKRFPGTVVLER